MNIRPMGPEGIRARMAEIRARLDSVASNSPPGGPAGPVTANSRLSGSIGSDASGFRPVSPTTPGITVAPANAGLKSMVQKAATAAGVDPALFDALIASESGYDPNARSRAGAMGLSQLMPGTAKSLGVENPFDPWQNLQGGARYLAQMMSKFKDPKLALAAYNAGPGAVERAGGIPNYKETQGYVEKVMRLYELRRSE